MAPTTTTTRPRSHDRKRMKHSTIMPIHDSHRRSFFRYSSINNSGTSLNSILEVDQGDRREEAATCTTISSSSRVTQSPPPTGIAHTDFWHSTRTMKKTQPCTSLSGLLDIVSMENDDDDDDDDEEEEIDEDFDKDHKKMDGVDDDDIHNTVSVTSSIRDSSISSFSSNNSQEEADGDGYFFFEDDDNNDYENDENCEWGLQF
mmetsp:Transcript_30678/g.34282  ORF Transcript_30678/g.34282 Transcript_30678/m.34282 type:complete len:203 (-) Transcript_30678:232-840(-)